LLLLLCLGWSCKKIDKLTQFNINHTQQVTIPSSTGVNLPFNILTPDITTNSESTFASNNTRKDLIEEIKLTNMNLIIQSPTNGNFNFLKSISIYIKAEGLAETRVAWKDNIANNQSRTLSLDITEADLKEYIKKDKYTLRLNTVMDELITSDHTIKLDANFYVDAKILGQ
jgi:hypothetical protein